MVLLGVTLALLGFGLVMVWSASSALAQERHDSPYYFLVKQVAWGSIGLVGMVLALRLDYKTLRRPAVVYPLLIVSTLLLIVVLFLPAGERTHRWIRLGALSFQPAELAKIAIVLFLAYHIERRAERINELVTLFPALCSVVVRLPGADPAGPRQRLLPGAHRLRDAVRRRRAAQVLRGARGAGARRALRRGDGGAVAARAHHELHQPVGRSAGGRLPRDPEPDRGRHRRRRRASASWKAARSCSTCRTPTATSCSR
jgi:hypothetical protein